MGVATKAPLAFILDDIAEVEECGVAIKIADLYAVPGGGYGGNEHYHGQGESFSGLVPVPVNDGNCPFRARIPLVMLLERMRQMLVQRFGDSRIRCCLASLAKRESVEGAKRGALSHEWHCDHNTREEDAWRAYTAVLYLNDDYEGGEVAFQESDGSAVVADVKVGRMVGFDGQQAHGVMSIVGGARYTLVGWYGIESPDHPPLPPGYVTITE